MPNRTSIGRSTRSVAVGTMLYLLGAALFAGSVQAKTTVKGTWQEGAPRIIGQGREVMGQHRDGHSFPIWLAVNEVRLGGERVFVGSIVELSEQKSIESDLLQSQETTRAILATAINPIITINAKGIVCSFNPAAEKLFAYDSHEILGQNIKIIMPHHL